MKMLKRIWKVKVSFFMSELVARRPNPQPNPNTNESPRMRKKCRFSSLFFLTFFLFFKRQAMMMINMAQLKRWTTTNGMMRPNQKGYMMTLQL